MIFASVGISIIILYLVIVSNVEIINKTSDLHSEPNFWNNIETEHEKMFSEQGIKIKAIIAKKNE